MTALRSLATLCTTVALALMLSGYTFHEPTEQFLAPWDPACQHMVTSPAPIYPPQLRHEMRRYFEAPIPRIVHQMWLGPRDKDQRGIKKWQRYAEEHGYKYRLWTDADEGTFRQRMPKKNYELYRQYRRLDDFWGASDLVRLSLLEAYGGTYVDIDIWPPSWNDETVDFDELVPMRNIVFSTEKAGRTVIESSLFVPNGFVMAAQGHPLIRHLVASVAANVEAINEGPFDEQTSEEKTHPMYTTGPVFVSRSLSGAFTIFPFNYMVALHMREYEPGAE